MAREVKVSVSPHRPILHSQLVPPKRKRVPPAPAENCDSLWTRVNRICDRYMPELFDTRLGPNVWWTPGENVPK
jgi:hypothetical protein